MQYDIVACWSSMLTRISRFFRRRLKPHAGAQKEGQFVNIEVSDLDALCNHLVNFIKSWSTRLDGIKTDEGASSYNVLEIGPGAEFIPALYWAHLGHEVTVTDPYLCNWQDGYHIQVYEELLKRLPDFDLLNHVLDRRGFNDIMACYKKGSENLSFARDGAYTLIYSNAVLEHIVAPKTALAELYRVSASGCIHWHQVDLRWHRNMERYLDHLLVPAKEFNLERVRQNYENGCQWRQSEWCYFIEEAGFRNIKAEYQYLNQDSNYFEEFLPILRQSESAYRDWPENDLRINSVFYSFQK